MAIWGIGVDVVDVRRFEESLDRTPGMRSRIFTEGELGSELSVESLAGRFAAKEALAKAFGAPAGMTWQDIDVVNTSLGAPEFVLAGAAAARVNELAVSKIHLSLAHDAGIATAFVVVER